VSSASGFGVFGFGVLCLRLRGSVSSASGFGVFDGVHHVKHGSDTG